MQIPPAPVFRRMQIHVGWVQWVNAQSEIVNEPQAVFPCQLNPLFSLSGTAYGKGI